jgi:integrase
MDRPTAFTTRQGNRVYRTAYIRDGVKHFTENYTLRVKRGGKQHYFNLGPDKKEATRKADEIAAFLGIKSNPIEEALRRYGSNRVREGLSSPGVPTVGVFCDRYREVSQHLSPTTIEDNITALQRIAASILGIKPWGKRLPRAALAQWREKVNRLPLSAFTVQVLEKFRNSMLQRAGDDHLKRNRATTTSNFYLRAAGSMFSPKLAVHYADFLLPSPSPFREVRQLQEAPHRYVSKIDVERLVTEAREELAEDHPASYLVFVLSLFCGMRRAEIDRLTWDQIDFEGRHIWIRTTAFFRPKAKNSENRIDAPEEVFEVLRAFRSRSETLPFVLPGIDPKARPRCRPIFNHLLGWLRAHGVDHVQALHALRKEAGSLMFRKFGSIDLAAEFLRNDPRVAREHYIGRKGRLEMPISVQTGAQK